MSNSAFSTLSGIPDGYDAFVIAEFLQKHPFIVYIVPEDQYAERFAEQLAFFAPQAEILIFPAWDCLPYDRVSPHSDVIARRLDVLMTLLHPKAQKPRVLIVPAAACIQRTVPPAFLQHTMPTITQGQTITHEALLATFLDLGYRRCEVVREWGEFAVRGGLIDVYPTGVDHPLRLDFFGDMVETIKTFDPITQRSMDVCDTVALKPIHEVFLTPATIERFREGYRALIDGRVDQDPLYTAVSAGRRYMGMEHWMSLFYEECPSLMSYCGGAQWFFDAYAREAIKARQEQIRDHYETRLDFQKIERKNKEVGYIPVPPEQLYLMEDAWEETFPTLHPTVFYAFTTPDSQAVDMQGRLGTDFTAERAQASVRLVDALISRIRQMQTQKLRVVIAATSAGALERIKTMLHEHGWLGIQLIEAFSDLLAMPKELVGLTVLPLERGIHAAQWAIITEHDIFGERLTRGVKRRKAADVMMDELSSLEVGDYVVHAEHGIAHYHGLETVSVNAIPHDCLVLVYEGGDKLFVPVESMELVTRYGASDSGVSLDRLGSHAWQARKAKVKERLKRIADHLIHLAAERELKEADVLVPQHGSYDEFCARFPYHETDDQLRAIEQVMGDLATGKPMDRLVCGDVGFGKTEVAIRAAFVAASQGQQVALVVPTTLLARQHYANFSRRFAGTGIKVGQLSRLVSPKEAKAVKNELEEGKIHIIITTHAILSGSVKFNHLGLLIVDEEQHFGVKQKEKLKELKKDVHVLTLTATPIPRTLQMALSGVRELSLIATPPVDRMVVRTFVVPFDGMVIREALLREHYRGGQSFYVCPRIEDLPKVQEHLRTFVPEVKFAVAHGGLPATQLDEVMATFCEGHYDVLVATNIIESGIDIPSANTLIVHRSDRLGLAQLYQLRGRVGRAKVRGYAYFTLPVNQPITETAKKRLEVLQSLDALGAGFTLASHDLEIRGAGNLLGEEQSGHIREVGVELYQHMLEQAVQELKSGEGQGAENLGDWSPQINIGVSVLIPESYVTDLGVRLGLYKRLSKLAHATEIERFGAELIDRFGALPAEVHNLLSVIGLKVMCKQISIDKWEAGPKGVVISFRDNKVPQPEKLIMYIQEQRGMAKIRPDQKIVFIADWEKPAARLKGSQRLLEALVSRLGGGEA